MDRILISLLSILVIFGWSGIASFLYFVFLKKEIVQITYATLSTFTMLVVYYFYGLLGLLTLTGAVVSMICAGAMFWFDMSLQEIQDQANDMTKDKKEDGSVTPGGGGDNEDMVENTYLSVLIDNFYRRVGLTEEWIEYFKDRYQDLSKRFDAIIDTLYGVLVQLKELTQVIPIFSTIYSLVDYIWESVASFINSVISLKELSKMSRQMSNMGGNGSQSIDLSALEGLLGGLNSNSRSNSRSNSNDSIPIMPQTGLPQMGLPQMGLPNLGGFDLNQMAEIERNMTPQQKKQAEEAAMKMMNNMDFSQMGDMMSMFGMGPPPSTVRGNGNVRNPKVVGKNNRKNKRR